MALVCPSSIHTSLGSSTRRLTARFSLFAFWLLCAPAFLPLHAANTKVDVLLPLEQAAPGTAIEIGVRFRMNPGWHIYWRNSGESGGPPKLDWTLPPGFTMGEPSWPVPEKFVDPAATTLNLEGEAVLIYPVRIAADVAPGNHTLQAKARWIECEKECVMAFQDVSVDLTIGASPRAATGPKAKAFVSAQQEIPQPLELPKARARWLDPSSASERRISWEASLPPSPIVSQLEFWAYESTNATIRLTNQWSVSSSGELQVTLTADKLELPWPSHLEGLLLLNHGTSNSITGEIRIPILDGVPDQPAPPGPLASASASRPPPSLTLPRALGLAFLGGLILNIMPCVLPVISLKILGFVQQSGDSPARVRQLGLIYALGVVFSFLVLAGAVIGLQKAGNVVSWGQQFGNPQFLIVLTTLITLVALNLFGLFEVTLGQAANAAGELAQREGHSGAFFNGMLAVILATPCTAPFMGPAIGFAFTQPPSTIIAIFLCVALGLASPYVILSWNPKWMKILPRPGVWMERFKVAMGFPMLATAFWLFSLTQDHFGSNTVWLGIFLVVVSAAAWVFGQFVQRGTQKPAFAWAAILLLLAFGYGYALEKELDWRHPVGVTSAPPTSTGTTPSQEKIAWQPWSPAAVQKARSEGRIVFVDFTAAWCLTCKVNMRSSIDIPSVRQKFKEWNVVTLLADYTHTPAEMTTELLQWNRAGVPLVLVYPSDVSKPAEVLPELLTPSLVLEALERARK